MGSYECSAFPYKDFVSVFPYLDYPTIPPAARVPQEPCFDLCGRRSRVRRRLQAAPGTTSARRGVVWVYPVVVLPGEVVRERGKVPRGAVT